MQYVEHHPYFVVREITVSVEHDRLTSDDVERWAGIRAGMNIWELEPREIEERLPRPPLGSRGLGPPRIPPASIG